MPIDNEYHFETDLDGHSTTVSDGTITQSAAAALASTSGGVLYDLTTGSTAERFIARSFTTITTETDCHLRGYFARDTLAMTNGDSHDFVQILSATASPDYIVELRLQWSTTPKFRLQLRVKDDALANVDTGTYDIGDTWPTYWELHAHKATNGTGANDAYVKLYLDGSLVLTAGNGSNLDLFDLFNFNAYRIGFMNGVDSGCTGKMHVDEVRVVTDSTTTLIGAYNPATAPSATVPGDGICINIYGETAVAGISVTEGTSSIVSVATTSTAGSTLTYDTTGTSVTISGNGTNAATLSNGASEAEYNTVLGTLTMRGTTVDTTITVTVIPTDGTLNDNETFDVFCDPNSLTATGSNADVIAWVASVQVRILAGQTNDTISVHVEDDTGTPLEVDSSFVVGLVGYFQTGDGDLSLTASTRVITDVIM